MTLREFQRLTQKGTVLLDGATGSNLRKRGMPAGVCTEAWAAAHPRVVLELQREYVDAGSRIIYAPTLSANRIGLAMHGLEDRLEALNRELVALSRQAAHGRALVAGNLTTTGRRLSPGGELRYGALVNIYLEQIEILADAGADLLVAETMLSLEEAQAALEAAQGICRLPVMCSLTVDGDGNLPYGGTLIEAAGALQEMGAAAVGVNCCAASEKLESVVRAMKEVVTTPLLVKPNAGIPESDSWGNVHYPMDARTFARHMRRLVQCGATLIGGCCGTDPEYIRRLGDLCPEGDA